MKTKEKEEIVDKIINAMRKRFTEEEMDKLNYRLEKFTEKNLTYYTIACWTGIVCWGILLIDLIILLYLLYDFFK